MTVDEFEAECMRDRVGAVLRADAQAVALFELAAGMGVGAAAISAGGWSEQTSAMS